MRALLLLFLPFALHAQVADFTVPEITVTGEQKTKATVPAVTELSGAKLERKRQATIGETLAHEAGVSSSQFGQSASRPVIRGEEGDRVKILQNGTGVLDASAASQDHAVAVEPLTLEKIEILRGPGALLYGPSAVGGVVNMTTNRIPQKIPTQFSGKLDSKFSSTDLGRSFGLGVNAAASSHWALHADASNRASDDYHANGTGRVKNSYNKTASGALGVSYVFDRGYVGGSFSDYESHYGTLVEEFSHINLLQQRWDLEGEYHDLGWIDSIRAKNSFSHYKHDEVEQGGELGTSFKNDGDELRVEAYHKAFAGVRGVIGAEGNRFTFSAKGEEAFIPTTDNQTFSGFLFEEAQDVPLKPSLGLRVDNTRIASRDDAKFGVGQNKSYTAGSAALGGRYEMGSAGSLLLNIAYTERAPNYEELFANGPHAATAQIEVGDLSLNKERSQSAELTWKHAESFGYGSVGGFIQDYHNYISLAPTGTQDGGLDIFRYVPVEARFYGFELEYHYHLPDWIPAGKLELEIKGDTLRAYNRQNGENLPRITPLRETLGLVYRADRYAVDAEAQHFEKQTLTAPNETATGAYAWVNLGMEAPINASHVKLNLIARVYNVFDVQAKNHVSVIKDVAPLPGRNFTLSIQAAF